MLLVKSFGSDTVTFYHLIPEFLCILMPLRLITSVGNPDTLYADSTR
jgi:hypothetical protein